MMINWDSDHPLLHAEMLGVRARALGASLLGRAAPTKAVAGKGGAAKKGAKVESKAGGEAAPVEVRESTVLGANILKEGKDPAVGPDEEYPDWLWQLLDKKLALSGLRRKRVEDMNMDELQRLVKLDNREKIKAVNMQRAKA